jgi:alanyl-tRNA synthetase
MNTNEIRTQFIEFFIKRGHAKIPPAPIVPPEDPTTLFTSSGMQQLVPFLKGREHPMGNRLVDSQPCFRAEDIEEIGDNRHTTFFEMLGNWSLGDYFKKEQLPWFFAFLTEEVGLDPKRLYVTVFAGDTNVPRDKESVSIWQEILETKTAAKKGMEGFDPKVKIYTYGADKNWWSRAGVPDNMPPGEIGGPDSEVFFDFGAERKIHEKSPLKDDSCHLNCECGRFLEIGNSVFMQYEKQKDGRFKPLPNKNVDFGGGLERIAAASQNTPDIFMSDLFSEAVQVLDNITKTNTNYTRTPKPYRIIIDHLRASIFMVSGDIEPSNKQQGYVLRRLIRRAMVYANRLGLSGDEWFSNTMPHLVRPYVKVYQQIDEKIPEISETITKEIDRFRKTIDRGLREINKTNATRIDGKFLFNSLATYGLPVELTSELVEEKGISISQSALEEFKEEYQKHQKLSRAASAGMFKGGLADKSENTIKLHTATHLLHKALREVLGDHVRQEGSHVTAERLRFDFSHQKALTDEEVQKVESLINQKIKENFPVHKTVENKDQALKSGALAFFKETYPKKVSVYTIGKDPNKNWFSKELCGGPHVKETGKIGGVEIFKQQAVGAGIRRVYAKLSS